MTNPVITIFDIETAPMQAYVWRMWKENVGLKQVVEHGYLMSFAWKELGEKEVNYAETRTEDDKELTRLLRDVLDRSDVVIAHNADRFDIPVFRTRCIKHGFAPPSPFKTIDTLKVAKREFRFNSNSLAYLSNFLEVEEKDSHKEFPGFELWLECMRGNHLAWKEMKKYNIQDVVTLEKVYEKLKPFDSRHPNLGVYMEPSVPTCPKCGGQHVHYRGYAYTGVNKYRKFQCQTCGGWGRSRFTSYPKEKRHALYTNAV